MTDTNGAALALVNADTGEIVARDAGWWERGDLVALAADQFMPGATEPEFGLFLETARALGLSPFARQIFAVQRWDAQAKRQKWAHQVSIDGLRLVATRTGKYRGQTPKQWCGQDGAWTDVWLADAPPAAARVGVHHADFAEPLYAVAIYREYVQTTKDGAPTAMWRGKPALMLAKCAEALALRAAFPAELSGVYTDDEMGQATVGHVEVAQARSVADVAADFGIPLDVLQSWWCRNGAAWDAKAEHTLATMTTTQLQRAAASIDAWTLAEQDAPPAEDEPKRGRKAKADAEPAPAEPEHVDLDPDDLIPPSTTVVPAEDDIPF